MINTQDFLNEIKIQDSIETDLQEQILNKKNELEQRRQEIIAAYEEFVQQSFPKEIGLLIYKYCGRMVMVHDGVETYTVKYEYSNCDRVELGYRINSDHTISFIFENGKIRSESLTRNLDEINTEYWADKAVKYKQYMQILAEFKEHLPAIYEKIKTSRQYAVDKKKGNLESIINTKLNEEPRKKYKITIEVEE